MNHPTHAHPTEMHTSYATVDEPTTATMNIDPFTFTEAHLSQEKITRKRETEEKKASQRKALCTHLFIEEDRKRDISGIFKKC